MKNKKSLVIIGIALVMFVPLIVSAQTPLVPCGTSYAPTLCSLCHLFTLTQNILNFLAWIIAPTLAVLIVAIGGFKILISGPAPGKRNEGINSIKIAITGLLIVFAAWVVINEVLLFFTNTSVDDAAKIDITNIPLPWHKIKCEIPEVTITPPSTPLPTAFNNIRSPELTALISCVQSRVPGGVRITSTTDTNIPATCDPMNSNERFNDLNNCRHTQYSCHYGGRSCSSRGSFAFDFGINQASDPPYAIVRSAIQACNSNAFVQSEGTAPNTHGHASIGRVNGCGCN